MQDDHSGVAKSLLFILMGTGGYIGFALTKDDPLLNTKKVIGGAITAAFVAWSASNLGHALGLPYDLAGTVGAVLGSQGPAGAYIVFNRVKRLLDSSGG